MFLCGGGGLAQIHYDGAREGDAVLEILGEGPATSTPAEAK
jgi:hypothetical protein